MRNLKLFFLVSVMLVGISNVTFAQGQDDFNTFNNGNANSTYGTYTTTKGWKVTNSSIVKIDGTLAPTLNGKTTAVGSITSPEISGGIGTLTLSYQNTFSESNGASFRIDIKSGSSVLKTETITTKPMTQNTEYTTSVEANLAANDLVIVITNLSPSNNSSSNKDRVSIYNIKWTGYVDNTPDVPAYITLSVAGEKIPVEGEHYVGDPYTLPKSLESITATTTCGDKEFVGWSTEEVDSPTKPTTPNYYDKDAGATVTLKSEEDGGNTFYAVFATATINEGSTTTENVSDVLNNSNTIGKTTTAYDNWPTTKGTSGAVYSGNSAGNFGTIQLRATKPSEIVTTISEGKVKSVSVVWDGNTIAGRTLDIYGKNTAYKTTDSDGNLYDDLKRGTNLGSIVCGTSTSFEIPGDYQYIGLRSKKDAMYLTSITIEWEQTKVSEPTTTYSNYTTSCSSTIDPVNPSLVVTPDIIDFSSVAKGSTVEAKKVKVQGANLKSKTLNIEQVYDEHFTLSTSTIHVGDDGSVDTELTITPTSEALNTAGEYVDQITITAAGDEKEQEIDVKLKVLDTYTVTWYVNGNMYDQTQVVEGQTINELPAPPADDLLADCDANKFMGWTWWDDEITDDDVEGLDLFTTIDEMTDECKSGKYNEFYAVFAKESKSSNALWVLTDINQLTSNDIFVFSNGVYAFTNSNSTSAAPSVESITIIDNMISSDISDNILWSISGNASDGFIFYPNGSTSTWLYCNTTASSGSNNNIRVGSGDRKFFILDDNGVLKTKDNNTTRYLCIYDNSDLRGYVNKNTGVPVIPKLYKKTLSMSYSNYITSCHIECPELVAPTLNEVTELYDNTATLNWNAVTEAAKYHVIVKQGSKEIVNEYTSETQYVVTGLTEQTEYTYSVQAAAKHSSCDESQASEGQFTTTEHQCKQLSTPTNLKIVREDNWQYTFSWDAVPNATEYKMQGVFSATIKSTSSTRSITVTPGNTYIVRVTAIGDGYNYCNSEEASIEFIADNYFTITFDPGYGYSDTESAKGGAIELPEATSYCEDWTFVGWSDSKLETQTTEAPTTLYKSGATYYAQADKTLYAVYSKEEGTSKSEEKSITLTASALGISKSGYNSAEATIDGFTFKVSGSDGGVTINSNIQLKNANLYNTTAIPNLISVTVNVASGSNSYTVYQGSSSNPNSSQIGNGTKTGTYNITNGNKYINISVSSYVVFSSIVIKYNATTSSSVLYYTSVPPCKGCENSGAEFEKETVKWGTVSGGFESPKVVYATGKENLSARTYSSTNTNVATVDPTTGKVTVNALGSTIIKMTQPRYVRDNAETDICAVEIEYLLQVGPSLDVVEWQEDGVIIHVSNGESNPKLIVSGEQEFGEGQMVADDLFFSKYFEAAGTTKLLAVFNGTDHSIDLTNITIWHRDGGTNNNAVLNLADKMAESGQYNGRSNVIYPQEELIFYNKGEYSNCEEVDEEEKEKKWIECGDHPAIAFGGKGTLTLRRTNDDGEEEIIDIIGAYKDGKPVDGTIKVDNSWRDSEGFVCEDGTNYLTGEDHYALSTNRCLLIRKNTVVSGAIAVKTNVNGEFETLCTEWDGLQIHGKTTEEKANNTCEGFASVGGFDYNDYYKEMVQIVEGMPLGEATKGDDEDTYFVKIEDLAKYSCLNLEFQLVAPDNASNIWAQETVKVPILVSDKRSTTDDMFTNIIDGNYEASVERCSTCDVVILPEAALTLANDKENNINEVRNIKVYPNAQLIVEDNAKLNSISFRRKDDEVGTVILNSKPQTKDKLPYNLDLYINANNWHFLSLPHDCKIEDVKFSNGDEAEYKTDWFLMYYDGEQRAQQQVGSFWKEVDATTTPIIKAGVGYIVGIKGDENPYVYKELRFPMAEGLHDAEFENSTVSVKAYGAGQDITPNNKGWNLIGNPYLTYYNVGSEGEFEGLSMGKLVQNEDSPLLDWELDDSKVAYISRPIENGWAGYEQVAINQNELPPFTCYFVQVGTDEHTDGQQLGVEFLTNNRQTSATNASMASLIRKVATNESDKPVLVTLNLSNEQAESDQTSLVIAERFSDGYDMSFDLVKWFGDNYQSYTRPVLYSIASDGKRAFNALPQDKAMRSIPLGFFAAQNGRYTISLKRTAALSRVKDIWLYDITEDEYTNLLERDYTFFSARAENNSRLVLSVRLRADGTTTADESVSVFGATISGGDGTLTVSNLPDHAQLWVYDLAGRLLYEDTTTHYERTFAVPQAGVYYVRIATADNKETLSTIVK